MRFQQWARYILALILLSAISVESVAILFDWYMIMPQSAGDIPPIQEPTGLPQPVPFDPGTTAGSQPSSLGYSTDDQLWEMRYAVYQELVSRGSTPLIDLDEEDLSSGDDLVICLLHGRADVVENEHLIDAWAHAFPRVPPVLVAAAIAEQASDVERLFGTDTLEKAVLMLPGKENMSIGIAQLRPTEADTLGLRDKSDLFEPETAIRGMFVKIQAGGERIDQLQDPAAPLLPTDRAMLLSLAQNNLGQVDTFFELGGDWAQMLAVGNNARVMRYYLVHLDWFLENGWKLSDDIDLDYWREIVFSTPDDLG